MYCSSLTCRSRADENRGDGSAAAVRHRPSCSHLDAHSTRAHDRQQCHCFLLYGMDLAFCSLRSSGVATPISHQTRENCTDYDGVEKSNSSSGAIQEILYKNSFEGSFSSCSLLLRSCFILRKL